MAPTTADTRDVVTEGEALALDTPIPTPRGWTQIQHLKLGGELFTQDGSITQVVAISPVWKDRPCISIKPHLSQSIIADSKHLWVTQTKNDRRQNYPPSIKTSSEISATLSRTNGLNHSIDLPRPLQLPHVDLPIPPYTLGAWLGDGDTRGHGALCQHPDDKSTIERIREDGFEVVKWKGKYSWGIHGLSHKLREAGLSHNKHVPEIYLRASLPDRIALVQGLMDTDGNVSLSRGQCQFSNTNLQLAQSLRELLLTLGFKPGEIQTRPQSRNAKATKDGYRLSFRVLPHTPCPFHMPRKAQRTLRASAKEASYRLIEEASVVEPRDTICIQVAHPSGIFLAGRDFVPTHNSGILACAHPDKRPLYEPSKRRLTFPNGAMALLFSAEEPERLRGPQFDAAWLDEVAAWQYPQETWDMLQFGLRLGKHPQVVISTTPKPIPLIRQLIAQANKSPHEVVLTTGSTYDNKANLAKSFFRKIAQYEGTRLGNQELHAQIIDPTETGIIKKSWFKLYPHSIDLPIFDHILQSYDTAYTDKVLDRKSKDPDPTAATTWGVFPLTLQMKKSLGVSENVPYTHGVLLLDAWSDHLGYPELRKKVQDEFSLSTYNERSVDSILIEDKGSGISLRQDLGRVVPIHPYNPKKADKTQRLHMVSQFPCHGLVFIPESRSNPGEFMTWAEPFIEQLCSFPQVVHDDYVDTFSQAMAYLSDLGYLSIDISEPDDEFDDYIETVKRNPYS